MPVDHDAAPAVAHMPLCRQVLVPGAEVLGIRCARRRSVAPDGRIANPQRAVCDDGDGLAQGIDRDIPAPDIGEILGGRAGLETRHALKSGVRAEAVQAKQEPRPQNRAIEGLVGRRAFQNVGEIEAEVGLLEHVEEAGHRPGRDGFGLDRGQVWGFGLGIERRHRDPGVLSSLAVDTDEAIARHARVEDLKRFAHFGLEIGDEAVRG